MKRSLRRTLVHSDYLLSFYRSEDRSRMLLFTRPTAAKAVNNYENVFANAQQTTLLLTSFRMIYLSKLIAGFLLLTSQPFSGRVKQKVLCNWGMSLKQLSAVHIQVSYSADVILLGSSSKLRLLVINLASVPDGVCHEKQSHLCLFRNCINDGSAPAVHALQRECTNRPKVLYTNHRRWSPDLLPLRHYCLHNHSLQKY